MIDAQPYAAEIKELLASAGLRVGSGVAPKSTDGRIVAPCVVLYMGSGDRHGDSVAARGDDARLTFRTISVAVTDEEALAVDATARDALTGQRLTIEDRSSEPITWDGSQPLDRDDDVTPPCFYVPSTYTLMSMTAELSAS